MKSNQGTLKEIFRLIKEQAASLQSRLSPEMSARCQDRSHRIRKLVEEISQHGDSKQPKGQH